MHHLFGVDNIMHLLAWKLFGNDHYSADGRAKRNTKIRNREWDFTDTERVAVAHKAASYTTLSSPSPGIEGKYRSLVVSLIVPSDALRPNSGTSNHYDGTSVGKAMSSMMFQLRRPIPLPFGATFRLEDASPKDASNLTTLHIVRHEWAQNFGARQGIYLKHEFIPQEPMHEELWEKDWTEGEEI
jgi:hypothetical protein